MDLRQLNAVLAVSDHGGFTAAARALHTVQSNISAHVARLEHELDATLIDRSTGHLTEEGIVVVERARRIQSELDALVTDVSAVRDEVSGPGRIGLIGTTARWLVPALVETMGSRHPRVGVVVHDATTSALQMQLSSGTIDMAVLSLPTTDSDLATEPLFDEDRLLVVPASHPFHDRERVSLADLDGQPLLLEPHGRPFRAQLEAAFAERGYALVPKAEVDGTRLMASLAFEGYGAAILPASAIPAWLGGDWRRVAVDGLIGRSVGLATRRQGLLSAPARALREVLRQVVTDRASHQPGIHLPLDT
jgi:LysR family hydrogen peroxide-inducible transcriptional activator